jgi:polysaccharide export outer membrane protein
MERIMTSDNRSVWRSARVLMVAVLALGASACAYREPVADAAAAPKPAMTLNDYQIGPADVLQISVWKNEELSRTVPVRPDGMISLPLVHDIKAAGLTPIQLRDVVAQKLSEYMPRPQVSVVVREIRSLSVSVLGHVKNAGRYEFKNQSTVLDFLANAGGVTEFASRSRILILRPSGTGTTRIPFNYDRAVASDGERENILVQPGDIIVVP